jgi:hypothetical protein
MPDDTRQPRQIRLEAIHSFRYCAETHNQSSADVSLGNSLIPNNNWLTKYDSVRLVRRRVAVIATPGGTTITIAAKSATSAIPIASLKTRLGLGWSPASPGRAATRPASTP